MDNRAPTGMTDPSVALASFQAELLRGTVPLQTCALDRDLFVHLDTPANGTSRFTYVKLDAKTVTALVMVVTVGRIAALPAFQIGCAVPEGYRNQGRAKCTLRAAIAEIRHGFRRAGIRELYIEAVVARDNEASKRVCAATFSAPPKEIIDDVSGLPALHYLQKYAD